MCWIYKQHSKLNVVDKHIFLNELKETLSKQITVHHFHVFLAIFGTL